MMTAPLKAVDGDADLPALMTRLAQDARDAARVLALTPTPRKDQALAAMAAALRAATNEILAANAEDVAEARAGGASPAFVDRLALTPARIEAMAAGIPVACSRVTALPEVTADAAILFDPRVPTQICAAILQLSCDEASRERLIVDGRARASRFADGDEMAREYWHVFEEAMAGLAPRRPGVTG